MAEKKRAPAPEKPRKNTANRSQKPPTDKKTGKVGHPVTVWTPEVIAATIAKFEAYIEATGIPSVVGFCAINKVPRRRLYEIEAFRDTIDNCVAKREMGLEDMGLSLSRDDGSRGSFVIFALKQLGWRDKQEVEHSGALKVQIIDDL